MQHLTKPLTTDEEAKPAAAKMLLPVVYEELRKLAAAKLAQETPGQTLQATALVHEAYLRLVGGEQSQQWNGRGHFFGAAAEAMRRVLIDHARERHRLKRGDQRKKLNLGTIQLALDTPADDLLAINEALERLTCKYPDCGELVKLRFFAGLSQADAAIAIGVPRRTADRYWSFARAWLYQQLNGGGQGAAP
jgi:RNA polymerase sigma factor (TIGR02999 family)